MKVLQINSTLNSGSTGRIAEEIGMATIESGAESYIAYGRVANPSVSKAIKIGGKLDQLVHVAHTRLFDTHGLHSNTATKKFVKQIQDVKPDIIHLHNIHGYYLNIEILFRYLKESGIPVVWTLHDCWAFTGHCCHYARVQCNKWQTECHKCPLQHLYPQSYGLDNSKNNFHKKRDLFSTYNNLFLVTVSKWLESQVEQSYFNQLPIKTIYNGVDLDMFKPKDFKELKDKLKLQNKKIILGVANVWSEGKGLNAFLELGKMITEDERILLIGLTKAQIASLPENIIGIERTASVHELSLYYSMADVFVNPSIAETFGMVTAEAMACGTPSIVYNSTAMPELIEEGVGYIVQQNNADNLYLNIQHIFKNGKNYYSQHCRQRAVALFDKKDQVNNYLDLYKNILNNSIDVETPISY